MVTHEPEQREFTDRVIWIRDGRLEIEEIVDKSAMENAMKNSYRVVN
jgi:ABC-type lipoprotein export system ATPase subunit